MSEIRRRDFLTGGAAAAATSAILAATRPAEADDPPPEPIRANAGATILGPTNPARESQSVDRLRPPVTDSGTLPTLRWSFADSHVKMREGGWSRQTTRREIPASTDLAMVNMRLKAGAVGELHWHKPAEWAFMLKGVGRGGWNQEHEHQLFRCADYCGLMPVGGRGRATVQGDPAGTHA